MQFFSPGRLPQPDGGPGRRAGLPGGVRRALPQRQLGRRAARHPRAGGRGAGAAGRGRADAADLPGRGRGRRQRLRLPGADRALPHPGPARPRATTGGWPPYADAGRLGGRARDDRPGPGLRRRPASTSPSSPSATGCGCRCGSPPGWPSEGIGARVVDLRWLAPLPVADLVREAAATGRVLVVDETRRTGGVGEGVLAALVDAGFVGAARGSPRSTRSFRSVRPP